MNHVALLESELQRLTRHLDTDLHQPKVYIERGMTYFKLGHIAEAIADFDRAEHLNPALTPYLWQRGLAYYYARRFADGAQQFEVDLTVNKHDVEETVWRYLCQAQLQSAQVAREGLLSVQNDSRPVMGWIYQLFAGGCHAETVLAQYRGAGQREQFYSHLYVGLYYEAERDKSRARQYITQAAAMQIVDDYMGWVAMVHQRLRGWNKC
jgi:tetratricopeptide (TPR) repeat protein